MTATSTEKRHGRIKRVSKVIRALHDSGVPGFTPADISYRCNHPVPSNGSLICTFADCPRWIGRYDGHIDGRDHCLDHFLPCAAVMRRGECPRGFQR